MANKLSIQPSDAARLGRDDWLAAALVQCEAGVDTIKIAPLAKELGVTTGQLLLAL